MPRRARTALVENKPPNEAAESALHDMEPELRQLDGVLTLLTILGEAQDSVEPMALASLAKAGRDAFTVLDSNWRTLFAEFRR